MNKQRANEILRLVGEETIDEFLEHSSEIVLEMLLPSYASYETYIRKNGYIVLTRFGVYIDHTGAYVAFPTESHVPFKTYTGNSAEAAINNYKIGENLS